MEREAQAPLAARERQRALVFIILTVFIDLLGVGLLLPVIPYLTARYRDDAFTVGALALAFSAAQFFALPVLGGLSDRHGRRMILLVSLFGSGIGYVLFCVAVLNLLARAGSGFDIVSGGELARISLAIAVIAATATPVATLIFDEVAPASAARGRDRRPPAQAARPATAGAVRDPSAAGGGARRPALRRQQGDGGGASGIAHQPAGTQGAREELARMLGGGGDRPKHAQHAA